ncbi:hypothetical protein [Deinococcus pimensis]|uniref:hypothetical protein n=1 Tax=Deinococcus pimensis TaxID=309888 RepID=UPI0004861CA2|nr:hypothetical protein [Deinococcus pimensis]
MRTPNTALATLLALSLGAACAATIPANLVGEWHSGDASTSGYVNLTTGQWRSARGSSFTLRLAADGTYEYVGLMVIQTAGCESRVFSAERGKATISGSKLSLRPTSGDSEAYVCDPKNTKKGSVKPSDWSWKLGQDVSGKEALFLGDVKGEGRPSAFTRTTKAVPTQTTPTKNAPATSAPAKPAAPAVKASTISGTVTATGGHSLKNTVVIACPNGDCESDGVRGAVISTTGSTATFVLGDLGAGPYAVYALQDNDANEDVNAGDWVNREYLADQDAVLVKVGTTDYRIELVPVK